MRELDGRGMVTRVKGRPVLVRRLRGLLVAVHRFGRCRASTDADVRWTARTLDALTAALAVAESRTNDGGPHEAQP